MLALSAVAGCGVDSPDVDGSGSETSATSSADAGSGETTSPGTGTGTGTDASTDTEGGQIPTGTGTTASETSSATSTTDAATSTTDAESSTSGSGTTGTEVLDCPSFVDDEEAGPYLENHSMVVVVFGVNPPPPSYDLMFNGCETFTDWDGRRHYSSALEPEPVRIGVRDELDNEIFETDPIELSPGEVTVVALSGTPDAIVSRTTSLPIEAPVPFTDRVLFINMHPELHPLAIHGAAVSTGPWEPIAEIAHGDFAEVDLPFELVEDSPEPPWGPVSGVGVWVAWPPEFDERAGPLLSPVAGPHTGGCMGVESFETNYLQVHTVFDELSTSALAFCFAPEEEQKNATKPAHFFPATPQAIRSSPVAGTR